MWCVCICMHVPMHKHMCVYMNVCEVWNWYCVSSLISFHLFNKVGSLAESRAYWLSGVGIWPLVSCLHLLRDRMQAAALMLGSSPRACWQAHYPLSSSPPSGSLIMYLPVAGVTVKTYVVLTWKQADVQREHVTCLSHGFSFLGSGVHIEHIYSWLPAPPTAVLGLVVPL